MTQALLDFDTPPRQHHSATSCAAAELITPHVGRLQAVVLEYIRTSGPCTDNEIIAGVGGNPNGPRARRIELTRKGLIEACGFKDGSTLWKAK